VQKAISLGGELLRESRHIVRDCCNVGCQVHLELEARRRCRGSRDFSLRYSPPRSATIIQTIFSLGLGSGLASFTTHVAAW